MPAGIAPESDEPVAAEEPEAGPIGGRNDAPVEHIGPWAALLRAMSYSVYTPPAVEVGVYRTHLAQKGFVLGRPSKSSGCSV